jgi:rhomboid family GlyGly-CTERM serine protease
MGLSKGEQTRLDTATLPAWLLPGALLLIGALLAATGDTGREWLRFERAPIADGELWRLATGHFVHLGLTHFLLNGAGLALVWFLVGREFARLGWLAIVAGSIAAIDAGLWIFNPELEWYVGLSGMLHGMLAAGIIASWRVRRVETSILGFAVAGKLAYEQLLGPLPGSEGTSGGTVIVDAHLYGVIGGAILAGILIRVGRTTPI